jgi:hypothetical protein
MADEYPVIIDGKQMGRLRVCRQGNKTVFFASCPEARGLIRLSVYGGGREGYLGVMQPENGGMCLRRTMGKNELVNFPDKITHAARRGQAQTEPAAAKSDSAPDTLWKPDGLGFLWAQEHGEKLCAIPQKFGIARNGTELPCRTIEGTEYRIFKI